VAVRVANRHSRKRKQVRICVIGAGRMANAVHYPSLNSFDDVDIVGICDASEESLASTADKYSISQSKRFLSRHPNDYQKMLKKLKPDGVYVIGPPNIMYDIWMWCLENRFNLYIEKPMGLSIHQARSLAWLADKNKCITQVSHQRRSSPLLKKMHKECLKRGPITHGVVEFFKCATSPFVGACDHMMDDCTHSVDTACWISGGEVSEVQSHCKRIGVPDINWIGAMLHFDNGSSCSLINTWTSGRRLFRVQMHAPGIYTDAEVEGKACLYVDGDYEGKAFDAKEVAASDEFYVYGGFRNKNREFIDSLKYAKDVCSSPFRDALKTMEICEIILAQALLNGQ